MAAQDGWPGPAPAEITAWTIVQAGHLVGRRFHRAFAEHGLTPTQFGALLELDLHPGIGNAALARAIHVTPQSTSELLTALQTSGLIRRQAVPGRGHRVPARLTPAGHARLADCTDAVTVVENSLGLAAPQRRDLNALLRRVVDTGSGDQPDD